MVRKLDSPAPVAVGGAGTARRSPRSAIPSCALTGRVLRADIGSPAHWRVTFRGDTLARLERVGDGRLLEWVERSADRRCSTAARRLAAPSPSSSNAPMRFNGSIRRSGIFSLVALALALVGVGCLQVRLRRRWPPVARPDHGHPAIRQRDAQSRGPARAPGHHAQGAPAAAGRPGRPGVPVRRGREGGDPVLRRRRPRRLQRRSPPSR